MKEKIFDNQKVTSNSDQLNALRAILPECFDKEGNVIRAKFEAILAGNRVDFSRENYTLNWLGKSYARVLASEKPLSVIREDEAFNANKNSGNLLIKGDNLEALKHLKNAYYQSVKMIYIDPPYNTGDDFIYHDSRRFTPEELASKAGIELEEAARLLEFNAKGSNTHSAWLTFMFPRLKLARELLREDGVIFISIDDNEQAQLKLLCDEVFGEGNFINLLCVVDNLKGNNNTDGISKTHEYCLVYAKNKDRVKFQELILSEDDDILEKWNLDELGYWKEGRNIKGTGENAPREKRPSMFYPIYLNEKLDISLDRSEEFCIEVFPITNGNEMCWNWSKDFLSRNKHELIVKKVDNSYNFVKKQRPGFGDLPSKKLKTSCYSPKYSTSVSSNTIKTLFQDISVFNYSKSVYLIQDLLQISTTPTAGRGGGRYCARLFCWEWHDRSCGNGAEYHRWRESPIYPHTAS